VDQSHCVSVFKVDGWKKDHGSTCFTFVAFMHGRRWIATYSPDPTSLLRDWQSRA